MPNTIKFKQVEKNARIRDLEMENEKFKQDHNEVSKAELEKAMETMAKATGKELYIGTKKSPYSRVRFAQILQSNYEFLREKGYFTAKEKAFLMDIVSSIAFNSNCIVDDVKSKNPVPLNISELAKKIGLTRANTSLSVNSLVKKGILAKTESGIEGNNAKAYSLFVNPHIIYAGDKENINEALRAMFYKAMQIKLLKDLPDKLF
ncbi:MarR family transcriptional regulator [Bacillus toyonensis]|uniref:MarR family transcriptional regulator n=1 Tax=Bacillus toyonensis TaxID=155322 RepID=UPI001C0C2613|nr:MarR family transcriptional regulator [Bacillus toyonensis]MBU4643053.1 MarR family transcriptional regulator [Bacillus toyonensis]